MTPSEFLDRVWGVSEPAPVTIELGPWVFEVRADEIANLAYDGSIVARSIRAVARDRDWRTVPAVAQTMARAQNGSRLQIAMQGLGADISSTLDLAHDGGRLTVSLEATSHAEFLTNRLGLVVLHPPTLAGEPLIVGTSSGQEVRTVFPAHVSPHQPATDIRSLAWTSDGVDMRIEFMGEIFEMEDQRNWTDASYKTYSRPLALPFPFQIAPGETVHQSVIVTATRFADRTLRTQSDTVEFVRTGQPMPEISLGATTAPDADLGAEPYPLPAGLGAVLVELDTRTPTWRAALRRAAVEASGLPLDVRIVADDEAALREAVTAAADSDSPVARLGVFSGATHVTEPPLWRALQELAGQRLPGSALLGGARSHFTELNREHGRLPADIPELTFSLTPQMHATERAQLIESIPMQATVVRNAGQIAGKRLVHVGPITLRPRFNAVATTDPRAGGDRELERGYGAQLVDGATDQRQSADALEAWTVASFAAIAQATDAANVASVSYFETTGQRGIRDGDRPYPVARAIASLAGLRGTELILPAEPAPEGLWCIGAARADGSWQLVAANLGTSAVSTTFLIDGRKYPVTVNAYDVLTLDGQPGSPKAGSADPG
jgi:hypothetical protein